MQNTILSKLLSQQGKDLSEFKSNTNEGKLIRRWGVKDDDEFKRIRNLPRRCWETAATLPELVRLMTEAYKTLQGMWTLRPAQAVVLQELHDYGGSVGALRVSGGKTLISFLAPVVTEAKRPLLLIPAKHEKKTQKEFRALAQHWKGCRTIETLSYEKLSREKQADFLERFQPDLIIADEAHKLKNLRSGRTKRVKRYMKAHPKTMFLPLSGTMARNSLHDYAHLVEWALKDNSPLPRTYTSLADWASALDIRPKEQRLAPGVLSQFCDQPATDLEEVRGAFIRRRNETPGWVTVASSGVDCSLIVEGEKFDDFSLDIDAKFAALRNDWQTPTGEVFTEPQKLWSYLRSCSLGLEYFLDPKPPEHWLECSRAWGTFCRDAIAHNRRNWDTEAQIALACSRGEIAHHGLYDRWKEVKPQYDREKNRHQHWFSLSAIEWCLKWLENEKGILFTPFIGVGEKLSELSGLPYFGAGGESKTAGSIVDYKGGPAIVSLNSAKEGFNLQDRWSSGLVLGGVGSQLDAEQLLGRLHRSGQEADEVNFTLLYGCLEVWEMWQKAREEAPFEKDPNHKLLCCDWLVHSQEDAEAWNGPRWVKSS